MKQALALIAVVAYAASGVEPTWIARAGGMATLDSKGRITAIDLRSSWVTDSDLREIAQIAELKKLDLSLTRITDRGLKELREAPGIEDLNLYYAEQITDEGMAAVRGWKRLKRLNLRGTKITDTTLEHLSGVATLEALDIGFAQVTDSGLDNLAGLSNLKEIAIGGNKLTDSGLQFLRQLPGLNAVNVSGSQRTDSGLWSLSLTEDGMDSIAVLKDLRELRLGGTAIAARGLEKLKGLHKLELLNLQGCKRVGNDAAPVLASLQSLRLLDLNGTAITEPVLADLRRQLPHCQIRN
jgi:internalin A